MLRATAIFCAVLGLILMGVNLTGLFWGDRFFWQPPVEPDFQRTVERIDESSLNKLRDESEEVYFDRITKGLALHTIHYWLDFPERASWSELSTLYVPLTENYVIYFNGLKRYWQGTARGREFYDAAIAMRRGYGFCSQHAMILVDVLTRNGFANSKVGLSGHVVLEATLRPGVQWVLDADYGVVVPHSMAEIEKAPEIIRPYYMQTGLTKSTVDMLVDIYGAKGNSRLSPERQEREWKKDQKSLRQVYALKWLIPAVLMAIAFSIFYFRARVAQQARNRA